MARRSSTRRIIWDLSDAPTELGDQERFAHYARLAAEHGATHVCVSRVPPSRWQLRDRRDPHPEWAHWPVWSVLCPSIFKVSQPPELDAWLPREEADRNLELVAERSRILAGLGLRATFHGNDPMWLPEEVWQAHPEWRGAQAELLRIAHLPYWSPCIDHPEVLGMYRRAVAELCRRVPNLDEIWMFTNDSAGGVCWSGSYPGANGPDACRERPMMDRLAGFLGALQEGGREAGAELAVNVSNLVRYQASASLAPGQYLNEVDRTGARWGVGIGSNRWFANHCYPVMGIPRPMSFAAEMEHAFGSPSARVTVYLGNYVEALLLDIYRAWRRRPTSGLASRYALLRQVAADRVGKRNADRLVQVWQHLEDAIENARHCRGQGYASLLLVGPAMMRWVTMPLIPEPRPGAMENAYYERHRVAKTELEAASYHALLGTPGITGAAGVWMARNSLNDAIGQADAARRLLEDLRGSAESAVAEEELNGLHYRIQALASVYLTCRNFIEYEHLLSTRGATDEEVNWRDRYGTGAINRGSYELRLVARSEADNASRLAKLIEEAPGPVLAMAAKAELEDALVFGPDLAAQLRRKSATILDHWPDYERLYPAVPVVEAPERPANPTAVGQER